MLVTDSRSTKLVYNGLSEVIEFEAVILENKVPTSQFLKFRLKKLGFFPVLGQLLFQTVILIPLSILSKKRLSTILEQVKNAQKPIPEEKIIRVESVNSDAAREALKSLSPKVILVNGTRIIGKKTLTCINAPFINTHVGITPRYRGVHGGYWALTEGNKQSCGVTVHMVDTGVDTGAILGQALINPTKEDNFTTYPTLQTLAAIGLLKNILPQALNNILEPKEPLNTEGGSKQWYHPTIFQYLWYWITKGVK